MSSRQTPTKRGRQSTRSEASGSRQRAESPLSPTRISRNQEKQQLQTLNDRLAQYIERVSKLEKDKDALQNVIERHETTVSQEVNNVRTLYETELGDIRRALNDASKDKAALGLEAQKLERQNKELLSGKNKAQRLLDDTKRALQDAEAELLNLKRHQDENADLRAENENLKRRLNDTQKKLEEETLQKVDIANQLTTSKEILDFKVQEYETKINEMKTTRTVEISELDGRVERISEDYERQIQDAIDSLRAEHEDNLRSSLDDMQDRYETQLENLKSQRVDTTESYRRMTEEIGRVKDMYENQINDLKRQIEDERKLRDDDRKAHLEALRAKDAEIRRLENEILALNKDYQELIGIKISLDTEIATYRAMLDGEERRLNISLTPGREGPGTPSRPAKRKRTVLETEQHQALQSNVSSTGVIEISEDDEEGKFIKIQNKGEEDVSLGGWTLKRIVGEEEVFYKFTRTAAVKAGEFLTVWSAGQDITASSDNIIMARNKKWIVGDEMKTVLANKDGDELSTRESSRRHESSSHTIERRFGQHRAEMFHQVGDPGNRENCAIM